MAGLGGSLIVLFCAGLGLALILTRIFVFQPFSIPAGSMAPTLVPGDFILVNKLAYNFTLPFTQRPLLELDTPKRGEVIVFRYPEQPSVPFIKRVIGLPGDTIETRDKDVIVNGRPIPHESMGVYHTEIDSMANMNESEMRKEDLGRVQHTILVVPNRASRQIQLTVPADHYFVMGDNRDNSRDSRYWGTLPKENLIGKAMFIWWSAAATDRIGLAVQ